MAAGQSVYFIRHSVEFVAQPDALGASTYWKNRQLDADWTLADLCTGRSRDLFHPASDLRQVDSVLYLLAFLFCLLGYFSLEARQDREWNPEVAQLLHYEQQGDQVTLYNIRNFDWQADGRYIERWESRSFDLNQITGVNIITSYWMGPKIAHTLVSFDFANQKPLTFSIEIRKEKNEEFSAIGGFSENMN